MSIQWTLIAGFLYIEIGIIFIMLLSFIKPQLWRSVFTSRFIQSLAVQSNLYLYSFIGILLLFFGESVREVHKYSVHKGRNDERYPGSPSYVFENQMRLFHGQRNLYISGFALFCLFIIKRVASLISEQGQLKIVVETLKSQGERNAQFVMLQSNQAISASSISSDKVQSVKPSCDSVENHLSNCGDTAESDKKSNDRITDLENQIQKLEAESTKWKDLAETNKTELEELRAYNNKLKIKYGHEEESRKDK